MPVTINTNLASLDAQRNLTHTQSALQTSIQRLSSGLRINSAKDDSAGLAISQRMTAQINGLNQATRNANDAVSLAQTAEGSLGSIGSILQRMREIAVQSANDTNTVADRSSLQTEATQLSQEIDRVASSTQFNGKNLLDGTFGTATFQVGANASQSIGVTLSSATSQAIGIGGQATAFGAQATTTTAYAYNAGGAMTINGTTITVAVDDGVSYVGGVQSGATSALSVANAINAQNGTTNVTAAATTTVTSAAVTATTALASGDMSVNGVNIGAVAIAASVSDRVNQLVQAINAKQGTTGVVATRAGTATYKLTAADGRNIDLTSTNAGSQVTMTGFVIDATATNCTYGTLQLSAGKAITIAGVMGGSGMTAGTYALTGTAVDVTTQGSANSAITSIDTALSTVNTQRATLGALQSRFTSVTANLQSSSQNLNSARSQIQDADFAAETAAFTRNSILSQAGTAMLAQANSLPNSVLSLLQKLG